MPNTPKTELKRPSIALYVLLGAASFAFIGVTFTLMNPRPIFGAMFFLVPERQHDQTSVIVQRIGKFVPSWAGATLLGMAGPSGAERPAPKAIHAQVDRASGGQTA